MCGVCGMHVYMCVYVCGLCVWCVGGLWGVFGVWCMGVVCMCVWYVCMHVYTCVCVHVCVLE